MTALPLEVRFKQPAGLLSLNDRTAWRRRAEHIAAWRAAAHGAGLNVGAGPRARAVGPAVVNVVLPVPDRRRRDPHNYVATLKPIVDGLVDAGLWPDDTPEHVATLEPELDIRRDRLVRVVLIPLVCPLCAGDHHAARCELSAWANVTPTIVEL